MVFGGDLSSLDSIMNTAKSQIESFGKAEQGRRTTSTKLIVAAAMTWCKPKAGFLKINWDAAIDVVGKRMGIGFIVRDHAGGVMVSMVATKRNVSDPTTAEAIAAWTIVKACTAMGTFIKSDSGERQFGGCNSSEE